MDAYTRKTKLWLDKRFNLYSNGIYIPNQPVYGLSKLKERLEEYARSVAIFSILDRIPFQTVLDVGCADGYFQFVIRSLYGGDPIGVELSEIAVLRAQELFGVNSLVGDAHALPFADKSFDLCICSEVLEHVTDPQLVINELKRVTRGYVVLSTPAARSETEQNMHLNNRDKGEEHAHIHFFTKQDLIRLLGTNCAVFSARSRIIGKMFDYIAEDNEGHPEWREDFVQFICETNQLSDSSIEALRHGLITRYTSKRWYDRFIAHKSIFGLLLMDIWICRHFPHLGYDFIVVADCTGRTSAFHLSNARVGISRILRFVLKEVNRPLLERKH